ncbi:MAG: hypothetical protein KDB94_09655 [Acidobacteria bacterium]|nr:hypothetical protein [Acidobacteriota bacterium]
MAELETERPKKRRRKKGDLFDAYLARAPERDPRVLLPRSALPLARGAFLLHGVVAKGWSLAWLAAFLVAEFVLIARLAGLGERFAGGDGAVYGRKKRPPLVADLLWAAVALAATLFAGQALDRSTRGAWFGFGDGSGAWGWPSWGIVAYVALLGIDFVAEALAARRERRTFVPAAVLQASVSFAAAILFTFVVVFLAGVTDTFFGEQGLRALVATALVLARTTGDLAVLWLPLWAPRLEARQRRKRSAAGS